MSADVPRAMAAGPTRRRRRRRVGRLLVAAALLAGLVTAPHVVLAAVEGPSDSPSQHQDASKQCPGDDEDGWAAEDDPDHEPDEEDERGEKEGEEMEEGEDPDPQPPRASRQSPTQQPPSVHQPPATHEPAGDTGSGSGDEVLGS